MGTRLGECYLLLQTLPVIKKEYDMMQSSFLNPEPNAIKNWVPTREAAKKRLKDFIPRAGVAYAKRRNFELGPEGHANVSALSPWIRHRVILEEDVLRKTLKMHNVSSAEKFIQEVFWRGYFKGWLEHRPEVWRRYKKNVVSYVDQLEKNAGLARRYETAINAKTGIDCFDTWVSELIETGYLHNHARMWFASIWIYTLELPWELGADFFYRHLLDGDPASNTCSWRWICGLHTTGKTYLARASNIEQFTQSRFNPEGQLALNAPSMSEPPLTEMITPNFKSAELIGRRYGLLMTEEDISVDSLGLSNRPAAIMALGSVTARSVLPLSSRVEDFAPALIKDGVICIEKLYNMPCSVLTEDDWHKAINEWAKEYSLDYIATPRLMIGPVRTRLQKAVMELNIPLFEISRTYDRLVTQYTKRGFFGLKKKIPNILEELDITKG
jgi:deoxyribodipyrimidine photo-lyase